MENRFYKKGIRFYKYNYNVMFNKFRQWCYLLSACIISIIKLL